jgi:hypothetical protein
VNKRDIHVSGPLDIKIKGTSTLENKRDIQTKIKGRNKRDIHVRDGLNNSLQNEVAAR